MTKQQQGYLWIIGIILIIAAVGVGGYKTTKNTDATLSIGTILPLSGPTAYYGEQAKKGIELAREELNKSNIQVQYADSLYTPKGGVEAYQNLKATHKLNAIITLASPVSLALQPLINEDGVLEMATATTASAYSKANDLSFRTIPGIEVQAKVLANFIADKQLKRIGVIYLNNDFGISAKEAVKKQLQTEQLASQVIAEEGFVLETTDFRTNITKVKAQNPDGVLLTGTAAQFANIVKQAQELSLKTQFIAISSTEDPVLIKNAGSAANGIVYSYYDINENNPVAKTFIEKFKQKYGTSPDGYASEGYEAFRLVVKAFNDCKNTDGTCAKEYLENLKNYTSVFGALNFDSNGDVMYSFTLKTIKNNQFVKYE